MGETHTLSLSLSLLCFLGCAPEHERKQLLSSNVLAPQHQLSASFELAQRALYFQANSSEQQQIVGLVGMEQAVLRFCLSGVWSKAHTGCFRSTDNLQESHSFGGETWFPADFSLESSH